MRNCIEKKVVSRKDGGQQTVCARYEVTPGTEVLVPSSDKGGDMGLVVPEALGVLGDISPYDFVGPITGLAGYTIGKLIQARWGASLPSFLTSYPFLIPTLTGVALSIPLYWWKGKRMVISGVVTALVLGIGEFAGPKILGAFSGFAGDYGYLGGDYGLLTAAPVGALPEVSDAGYAPASVYQQADLSAWGQVI